MTEEDAKQVLRELRDGKRSEEEVLACFQRAPVAQLGFATVDTHRALRTGCPEVIFAAGKTVEHLLAIAGKILDQEGRVLATRMLPEQLDAWEAAFPNAILHRSSRCASAGSLPTPDKGPIAVVSAGTSDLPVAEEAALTAEFQGIRVERIWDVGVAGLHRILGRVPDLQAMKAIIVVAGMEGALPSVVGGLVSVPVIAVPTSVGYGASFQGLAALLGMLNSCSSGLTVVNIDNGFGAAMAVARWLRHVDRPTLSPTPSK